MAAPANITLANLLFINRKYTYEVYVSRLGVIDREKIPVDNKKACLERRRLIRVELVPDGPSEVSQAPEVAKCSYCGDTYPGRWVYISGHGFFHEDCYRDGKGASPKQGVCKIVALPD